MKEIKAFIRTNMIDSVIDAMEALNNAPGLTLSDVRGWGHLTSGGPAELTRRVKLETVVPDNRVEEIIDVIVEHGRTGMEGDGKIFISDINRAVRIRTGKSDDVVR